MSTIGDPHDKMSSPASQDAKKLSVPSDTVVNALFDKTLSPSSTKEAGHIKDIASPTMPKTAAAAAVKTARAAAGAGIRTFEFPLFVKKMTYLGPSLPEAKIYNGSIYDVTYTPGVALKDDVDSDVRALAIKDIPLPFPFNNEAYDEAKAKMEAVLVDPLEKCVFQKVTKALLHMTFDDLILGLQDIVPRFNEAIGTAPFSAVILKGKSNEWVTQIALHEGLKVPNKISLRLNEGDIETPAYHEKVVLIDDGSYSGLQMASFIRSICRASQKDKGGVTKPVTHFFVVVPFMTKQAKDTILKEGIKNGVEVQIISSATMPHFSEVLNEKEAECFKDMAFLQDDKEPFGPILAFADWRRPDQFSAPRDFLNGKMSYKARDGSTQIYIGTSLVPEILPPYKLT